MNVVHQSLLNAGVGPAPNVLFLVGEQIYARVDELQIEKDSTGDLVIRYCYREQFIAQQVVAVDIEAGQRLNIRDIQMRMPVGVV